MTYKKIAVAPVTGALGAEVEGVNPARSLADDPFEAISGRSCNIR